MTVGWETAVEGVVVGVASGSILGGYFWLLDKRKRYVERHEQIRFLARLITTKRELMFRADNAFGKPESGIIATAAIHKAIYAGMKREVEAALDGRSSRLSFDETNEIRNALTEHANLPQELEERNFIVGGKAYNNMFRELESIDWLNLTKGPYFLDETDRGGDVDREG